MDYNITYREKNNSFQIIISYKDNLGKWRQKSKQGFGTKREAKRGSKALLEELEKTYGISNDREIEGITFKAFTIMYLEHYKLHHEANTTAALTLAIKKLEALDDMLLNKITTLDLQNCVDAMTKEGLKGTTIELYVTRTKVLFDAAMTKYNLININPVKNLTFSKSKIKIEKEALTKSELKRLLDALNYDKHNVATTIMAKCGLRIGELTGLTWGDVDFNNKVLIINKQWKLLKSNKPGFGELKSKNSYRNVPISDSLLKELKLYKIKAKTNEDDRIFDVVSSHSFSASLTFKYKSLGFNISPHILRHTYATTLIANGIDFKTVAELMGDDVKMIIDVYSHVNSDMRKKAIDVIESIF